MVYSSNEFVLWLPVVLVAFYLVPRRGWQNAIIALASGCFLVWAGLEHLLVLLGTIAFAMAALFGITRLKLRFALPTAVVLLLTSLAYFKYRVFLGSVTGWHIPEVVALNWLLPLGISFYTLQIIAALLDLRDNPKALSYRSFGLFVGFFPHLIAGPIVKYRELAPQFSEVHRFRWGNILVGFQCFAIGYLKKVLIADPIAFLIDPIWDDPARYSGAALVLAAVGFYLQIYADFSGYTDMGRGVARMMGYRLPINFRGPFFAASPIEFYTRWHITLSRWIRDHLFAPLAIAVTRRFRRSTQAVRTAWMGAVIVAVMGIAGLWHGAAARYVLWGVTHGVLIGLWHVAGIRKPAQSWASRIAQIALFQVVLIATFAIFRSQTFGDLSVMAGRVVTLAAGEFPHVSVLALAVATGAIFLFQYFEYEVHSPRGRMLARMRRSPLGFLFFYAAFWVALFFKGLTLQGAWVPYGHPALFEGGGETFLYFAF